MSPDPEATEDKEVQTERNEKPGPIVKVTLVSDDEASLSNDESDVTAATSDAASTRTIEDCVAIYKSTVSVENKQKSVANFRNHDQLEKN